MLTYLNDLELSIDEKAYIGALIIDDANFRSMFPVEGGNFDAGAAIGGRSVQVGCHCQIRKTGWLRPSFEQATKNSKEGYRVGMKSEIMVVFLTTKVYSLCDPFGSIPIGTLCVGKLLSDKWSARIPASQCMHRRLVFTRW